MRGLEFIGGVNVATRADGALGGIVTEAGDSITRLGPRQAVRWRLPQW